MGFIEFLILCFVVLVAAALFVWAANYFAPGHPAIVDKLAWGVAILIILVVLLRATGILSHDVQIPHVSIATEHAWRL